MIRKRRCGNCSHYFSNWKGEGMGICQAFDFKCSPDYGKDCSKWKGKKYDRKENESRQRSTFETIQEDV
jgi:hypothetical protein